MDPSASGVEKDQQALSPRAARAKLEEDLGKLDITDEEATPLVVDDREEKAQPKWIVAGKVLHCTVFHIQTIASALRPAWSNPRGMFFRSVGKNMFVAEFATQRDRDRVWTGSPWLVSKNAVFLSEFEDYMKPSELKFDRLSLWDRIINLPFNLREKKWWMPIAKQTDNGAKEVQFDHAGGFLRARVTVDVASPLRRWILIDSARRQCVDMYEIEYEQLPHFCFSCGWLGHADLVCSTPGNRGPNGELPFGKSLRAADEWRKSSYSDGSMDEKGFSQNVKADTRNSSTTTDVGLQKVEIPSLKDTTEAGLAANNALVIYDNSTHVGTGASTDEGEVDRNSKRKKPTPTSSEIWQRLRCSPARSNELCESELSGAWNLETVRELRCLMKQEGPGLLFVMETKIQAKRVENLRSTLGFAGCFAMNSDGLSGGIGLFWSNALLVEIENFSFNHTS
ncbi:hypothetical protein ACQ4PT_013881 [Festuca glaucescens]